MTFSPGGLSFSSSGSGANSRCQFGATCQELNFRVLIPESFQRTWLNLGRSAIARSFVSDGHRILVKADGSRRHPCATEQTLSCRFSTSDKIIPSCNHIFTYLQNEIVAGASK